MQRVWFLYNHTSVLGPFDAKEVCNLLSQNTFGETDLIWKKGMPEWQSVEKWQALHLPNIAHTGETRILALQEAWYVAVDQYNNGPFSFEEVVEKIKNRKLPMTAKIWTQGLNRWIPLVEAQEIIDALGMSRREHMRVPITGRAGLSNNSEGIDLSGVEILTLSEGGFGVKVPMEPGQIVTAKLESPLLSYPVQFQAKVVYTTSRECGMQFTHISSEMHSAIVEYINHFKVSGIELEKPAA